MKTQVPPFILLAALAACGAPTATEQQPVAETPASMVNYYGDTITADGAMPIAEFVKATAGADSLAGKVECEIITSCQKKGCWMTVKTAGDEDMMVRFRDYGFFVPTTGLEGKKAVIQGHAVREVTDVAALRHYAEDEGKTPEEIAKITEPDTSWTFMADGVIIRD